MVVRVLIRPSKTQCEGGSLSSLPMEHSSAHQPEQPEQELDAQQSTASGATQQTRIQSKIIEAFSGIQLLNLFNNLVSFSVIRCCHGSVLVLSMDMLPRAH